VKGTLSKRISVLRKAHVTYSTKTLTSSTKLHGATPQKPINVIARRETIIPNKFSYNFGSYEARILSKLKNDTANKRKL